VEGEKRRRGRGGGKGEGLMKRKNRNSDMGAAPGQPLAITILEMAAEMR
jgi:hypothetical protein